MQVAIRRKTISLGNTIDKIRYFYLAEWFNI